MPSKQYRQRQSRRNRDVNNNIMSSTEIADKIERKLQRHRDLMRSIRKQNNDYVNRNRENTKANVKRRLQMDSEYRQRNRDCAKVNTVRRLASDETYRQKNIERAKINKVRRLAADESYRNKNRVNTVRRLASDETYRQKNIERAKINKVRRLAADESYRNKNRVNTVRRLASDKTYRQNNIERAKINKVRRLASDESYRNKNRVNTVRRLASDESYRQKNRQRSRIRKRRLLQDEQYREKNREQVASRLLSDSNYKKKNRDRSRTTYIRLQENASTTYREYHRAVSYSARQHYMQVAHPQNTAATNNKQKYTDRQKYWIRRTRLLTDCRRRSQEFQQQRKMATASNVSLLDVKLLYERCRRLMSHAMKKLKRLHIYLSEKASACLEKLPTDRRPTEDELTEAMDGIRYHTASSEPYFWEQSYKIAQLQQSIPVDSNGTTHVFKEIHSHKSTKHAPSDQPAEARVKSWECHRELCVMSAAMIDGVVDLLKKTAATKSTNCITLYLQMDTCNNPGRNTDRLGHPVHCSDDHDNSSLLLPARVLSCHLPFLRTYVARLYEQRRVSFAIHAMRHALKSVSYNDLRNTATQLKELLDKTLAKDSDNSKPDRGDREPVCEEDVVNKYRQALTEVANIRDTYTTTACDICEQIRDDIQPLTRYENTKGFNSEKMTKVIELLYQAKTRHEDYDSFIESLVICKYCIDKLRQNKDVARSALNQLAVVETPQCIQELNIFEKTLIKFCVTSVTILRLGQISNTNRPRNELNSALKGRIAYLPVDISATASFLPDNLLNVDNLVLLVGGQPTQNRNVWTSVVDLRKVHAALAWLKENNPYYRDVPAYTVEQLEDIIKSRTSTTDSTNVNSSENTGLLQLLTDAAKTHLYENFTIQPISIDFPTNMSIDYQMTKVNSTSANLFDTDLDVKAYPELFPDGENGMRDVTRATKISTTDYLRSRLLNKHSKFRLNINYLFHSFQVQEISNMCHSVAHMLRTVSGDRLSAKALCDRLRDKDGEVGGKLFALMANMRGTREYFAKLAMDVRWMIRRLGPPALFLTVSTAEWYSEPLLDYLRHINKDVPNIDTMTPGELCAMDPVNVSIHFEKKWRAVFKKLILSKETPVFGKVVDFFWRVEYQARGAPHIHCLLWIEDAPLIGKQSNEEVKAYIDSIATCSLPDKDDSPVLHELVTKFQCHKCNKYCTKSFKRNGQFYKKCRFGFPRPVKQQTEINDVIECLAVNKSTQQRKRLYHLQRNEDELNINDYNAALLLASQSNVDVQYIGHIGSRLPYYITSYITKHERSEQDQMWEEIYSASKSLSSNAVSFVLQALKSRQVGANEAADRLLGHKLYSKSRQMRFADLQPVDRVKRVLKPITEIDRLLKNNPESDDIFYAHWVLDVYPQRPDKLEDVCLHDLLAWYEKAPTGSDDMQLRRSGTYLRRRTQKPYIVTHKTVNPNKSSDDREIYFYHLLKLFKPWRDECELCEEGKTSHDKFMEEQLNYPAMSQYHQQQVHTASQDEEIDRAVREKARQVSEEGEVAEDEQTALEGCVTNHAETAMQDLLESHANATRQDNNCDELLQQQYQDLNVDQKRVVDMVVTNVGREQSPVRLIVSGQAGTGKSRVIDVLHRLVSKQCAATALPVVVAAPTGLAAFNINGTTIHRVLSLPVEHGKPADYCPLQQEQLTTLRATLRDLKLLIIDEVSMVSSLVLLYIHLRLTEIMSTNEPFGGVSLVFFADFLQLPPVKGNQPFQDVTLREAKQRLGSISSLKLWEMFQYDELTINMRQSADTRYAKLLSAVRIGHVSDEDCKLLQSRMISSARRATVQEICTKYNELSDNGQCPIILLPRTAQCSEINSALLQLLHTDVVDLAAIDSLDTLVEKNLLPKVHRAYQKLGDDVTRTGGLEQNLKLCVGAKVMLKRNLSVEAGLVNGSVGSVTGFRTQHSSNGNATQIQSVYVQFKNVETPVQIERQSCTFEVLKCIFYTRKQFPLMLAFAITVHKSQGLSLSAAIVDAGPSCFGSGMSYVALSRVTSVTGLHLIDFDKSKIICNKTAVTEYNRLRSLYTPHLGPLMLRWSKNGTEASENTTEGRSCNNSKAGGQEVNQNAPKKRKRHTTSEDKSHEPPYRKRKLLHKKDTVVNTRTETGAAVEPVAVNKATDSELSHSGSLSRRGQIFDCCSITSLSESFQEEVCGRLNLELFPADPISTHRSGSLAARELERLIYTQSRKAVKVKITSIGSDGNCLFRALSYGITRNEAQHQLIRCYIVNHMKDAAVEEAYRNLFATRNARNDTYTDHLIKMQQTGEWGTEQEIAAAAHLFDCAVLCYSRYSANGEYCLQVFTPHFATSPTCTTSCKHSSLYLVNRSGNHYELAIVQSKQLVEE